MRVEVWSDVACPWCYVGKRRLEHALASFEHRDRVEVVWRAFQLSPDTPRFGEPGAGEPVEAMLARRYGGGEPLRRRHEHLVAVASEEGIAMRTDLAHHVNTFDAHRLVAAAAKYRAAGDLVERLFAAQHVEGRRVDDPQVLLGLAAASGLPAEDAERVLAGDAHAAAVTADIGEARELGVGGVPFFVLERRFALSGAQPPELFGSALERAWAQAAAA